MQAPGVLTGRSFDTHSTYQTAHLPLCVLRIQNWINDVFSPRTANLHLKGFFCAMLILFFSDETKCQTNPK